jgi:hypothetical protein
MKIAGFRRFVKANWKLGGRADRSQPPPRVTN